MPLRSQLHVDKLLSNVSMKYSNPEFIHDKIFPMLPVGKSTDRIRVYDRNIKLQETQRSEKAKAREATFEMSYTSYSLEHHALKDYIGEDEAADNDVGDLRSDVTEYLTDHVMLRKEYDFAQLFATSGNWSNNVSLSAAQQWSSNTTTSNPIPIMDTAATTVLKQSGFKPNKAIVPHDAMVSAKNHTSVLDRVKYTSSEITESMLASLFGVGQLHSPAGQYDTTAEGLAESLSDLYADNVWVGYAAPRPGLRQVSAGYMLQRSGRQGLYVRRWIDDERDAAEAIEVNCKYQFRIIMSLAGYLIKDTQG